MALRVWLPLNGTLENNGISDPTIGLVGTPTVNNSGKIGKCYTFSGSNGISIAQQILPSQTPAWSFACWFSLSNTTSTTAACFFSERATANQYGYTVFIYPNNSKMLVDDGTRWTVTPMTFSAGTWYHLAVTRDSLGKKIYINGELKSSTTTIGNTTAANVNGCLVGLAQSSSALTTGDQGFIGNLNDVRIYDHALSAKEVKEISQGLVLHYKLDDNIQTLNNCYSYPTFNTSVGNGGWNHWGRSGHAGNQGQNTDKTYIYNKQNTYSHWVSNGSTATGEYLVYQFPAFDGGYRSLQAIIKEEESRPIPITGEICFPDWNARNGGTAANTWTSITSLGDGFYLCKCEGISQDGSDDLVGIFVKPGYKIYISEAYLENDREMCSEILFPRNYIIDSSGYDNNGVITGTLETNTSDRYLVSTKFPTNTCYIKLPEITYSNFGNSYTFSWWEYMTTVDSQPMPWGFSDGNRLNCYHATNLCWNTGDGGSNPFTPTKTSASLVDNKWHHMAVVGDGTTVQLYIDGVNVGKATTYKALTGTQIYISGWSAATNYKMTGNSMSDFRIYATTLSAEDILDLYHTTANIDNLGNLHTFELENYEDGNVINFVPQAFQSGVTINYQGDPHSFYLNASSGNHGLLINSSNFIVNKTYRLTFAFRKISGTLNGIGGHQEGFINNERYIDGIFTTDTHSSSLLPFTISDTNWHTYDVILTYKGNGSNNNLYIQINRASGQAAQVEVEVRGIILTEITEEYNTQIYKNGQTRANLFEENNNRNKVSILPIGTYCVNNFIEK